MEKQGWPLVVATKARQAWHVEQGCAQHRCQSLSKPQIKPGGLSATQPNSDSTRLA